MSSTLFDRIDFVRAQLASAADAEQFVALRERLEQAELDDAKLRAIVLQVSHGRRDQDEILAVRRRVGEGDAAEQRLFERYVLLRAAYAHVELVAALPVPEEVKGLLLDEYTWMAQPRDRELQWFTAGEYIFSALCKLATLRRFPAGQMHWEVAGLPRSVLWRVRFRDFLRLWRGIRNLGGFGPALVPHLAWRRKQIVLSELEHYRSLRLMANALEMQPRIRGFVAEAWFYSPDTPCLSPHLAWAPRLFGEWGGVVVVSGRAGAESGVYTMGRTRREASEAGRLRPTLGLAIWPRTAMLAWAAARGEAIHRAGATPCPPPGAR